MTIQKIRDYQQAFFIILGILLVVAAVLVYVRPRLSPQQAACARDAKVKHSPNDELSYDYAVCQGFTQ